MTKRDKKRKNRQKSGPDSTQKDEPKRQRKMKEYFVADDPSCSESDTDSDTEKKTQKTARNSGTQMKLEQILEGQSQIQSALVNIQDELNSFKQYQEQTELKLISMSERKASLEHTLVMMARKLTTWSGNRGREI